MCHGFQFHPPYILQRRLREEQKRWCTWHSPLLRRVHSAHRANENKTFCRLCKIMRMRKEILADYLNRANSCRSFEIVRICAYSTKASKSCTHSAVYPKRQGLAAEATHASSAFSTASTSVFCLRVGHFIGHFIILPGKASR